MILPLAETGASARADGERSQHSRRHREDCPALDDARGGEPAGIQAIRRELGLRPARDPLRLPLGKGESDEDQDESKRGEGVENVGGASRSTGGRATSGTRTRLLPAWGTTTAIALASTMYETRDFSPAPILADALEEAGCDNGDMLAHCRAERVHGRGCWVVDRLLGKS
jgi:hypothetical protein